MDGTQEAFDAEQAALGGLLTNLETFKGRLLEVGRAVNQGIAPELLQAIQWTAFTLETQQNLNKAVADLPPTDESLERLDVPANLRAPEDVENILLDSEIFGLQNLDKSPRRFRGRNIRSPWLPWAWLTAPEQDVISGTIAPRECMRVVKETDGLGLKVTWRVITVTLEPWTARARFAQKRVWVLEWVPKEIIKTITYCNEFQRITRTITIEVIEEPQKLHLWRFFRKDP